MPLLCFVPDASSMGNKDAVTLSISLRELIRGRGSLGRGRLQAPLGEGEGPDSSRFP